MKTIVKNVKYGLIGFYGLLIVWGLIVCLIHLSELAKILN